MPAARTLLFSPGGSPGTIRLSCGVVDGPARGKQGGMARFKVAHIKLGGIDVVLVPLPYEFSALGSAEQTTALRQLVQICRSARLGGEVVPVWQTPQGTQGFLANAAVHPLLAASLTPGFLKANLNREVTTAVEPEPPLSLLLGDVAGNRTQSALGTPAAPPPAPPGSPAPTGSPDTAPGLAKERRRERLARANRSLPTRLATLLFTDMVQSTKLKQEHGDSRGTELILKHHEAVRELLARTGGGEEISTAGDSFFIHFRAPSDAVKFSLLLQARLRQPIDRNVRVQDRIGIHVGEVFCESDTDGRTLDMFGSQVDTCARIMSLASGDQILMSRVVFENARQLLRGQQIPGVSGVTWLGYGLYELKGVEDAVELCEAGEAGRASLRAPQDGPAGRRATDAIRPAI